MYFDYGEWSEEYKQLPKFDIMASEEPKGILGFYKLRDFNTKPRIRVKCLQKKLS